MNAKTLLSIFAVFILIVVIGWQATSSPTESTSVVSNDTETAAPAAGDLMDDEKSMVDEEKEMMDDTAEVMAEDMMEDTMSDDVAVTDVASPGEYVVYSSSAVANSDANTKLVFFAASWCPSCRALDRDITASLQDIPGDVTIFKADYDSEITLRQTHGVTTQHTIVQVDANGNQIKKWSGGNTLESILAAI